MAELKPCPFCGSKNIYVGICKASHILKKFRNGYIAGCLDCKITTAIYKPLKTRSPLLNKVKEEEAYQKALDDWQRRVSENDS